jgi:hypothetical protein
MALRSPISDLGEYLGLDLAPNAGALLLDGKAVACRSIASTDRADLTLCLDVGIHESIGNAGNSRRRIIDSARVMALISGYVATPPDRLTDGAFSCAVVAVLAQHADDRVMIPVGDYQGVVTWAILVRPKMHHPRDLRPETIAQLPQGLLFGGELAALYCGCLEIDGLLSGPSAAVFEYPAVLRLLRETFPLMVARCSISVPASIRWCRCCVDWVMEWTTVDPGPR